MGNHYSLSYQGFSYRARVVGPPHTTTQPVVLLGGALMDMLGWHAMEQQLADKVTVVTVDLPGQGAADSLPATYGLRFLAESVDHMVEHLGLGAVNLVGTSFGSTLAYAVAQYYPHIVSHMVLVGFGGAPGARGRKLVERTCTLMERPLPDFGRRFANGAMNLDPSCAVRNRDSVMDTLIRYYDKYAPGEREAAMLRRVTGDPELWENRVTGVPALLVCGEHDHMVPPSLARRACSLIAGSGFTTIGEADHLVHLERPAELADVVYRFCSGDSLDGLDYLGPVERPHGATTS
ncbi:alpha/beta fold hydrolase [Streptomyces lavendofoliae]|uniref:alpha/beta fold hydrolase n=1 Tax=Streptomyces lavendofoliae TaxID=67314 RepID=UPI003D933CFB